MIIILDSNILIKDFRARKPASNLFWGNISVQNHILKIPRVVIKEVANRYSEFVSELIKDADNLGVTVLDLEHIAARDANKTRKGYETFLVDLVGKSKGEILDYPSVSHETLASRAIKVARPFLEKDRGYRDALIWYTILEQAKNNQEEIAFICSDGKGFQASNGGLHPHLLQDLTSNDIDPDSIKLYASISDFVEAIIKPRLAVQDEIIKELIKPENKILNLFDFLSNDLNQFIKGEPITIEDSLAFLEEPTIDYIDEVVGIDYESIQAVESPEENIVVISLEFNAKVSANALIPKDDVFRVRDYFQDVVWISHEMNEYYDFIGLLLTAILVVEFSINIKERKVISAQILNVDLSDYVFQG